jgi:hypothetical protein
MREAMGRQKAVGSPAQGGMVMKSPIAPFVMRQAKRLPDLPVIAFDPPAPLGDKDPLVENP